MLEWTEQYWPETGTDQTTNLTEKPITRRGAKNYIVKQRHELRTFLNVSGIYTIFENTLKNRYTTEGESHDFWELVFVLSGKLYADTCNKIIDIKEGEFILHQPNDYHRHFVLNNLADIIIVSFDCDYQALHAVSRKAIHLNQAAKMLLKDSLHISGKIFERYTDNFDFVKYQEYNEVNEQLLRNSLENLLIMIIHQQAKDRIYVKSLSNIEERDNQLISDVIKYLGKNIYSNLTIHQICKEFSICKTSLSVKFKKATYMSIIDYYNNIKIMKSMEFLGCTHVNISQVADMFHYSSSQYYSRIFKKYTGISPSEFIAQHKKKNYGLLRQD